MTTTTKVPSSFQKLFFIPSSLFVLLLKKKAFLTPSSYISYLFIINLLKTNLNLMWFLNLCFQEWLILCMKYESHRIEKENKSDEKIEILFSAWNPRHKNNVLTAEYCIIYQGRITFSCLVLAEISWGWIQLLTCFQCRVLDSTLGDKKRNEASYLMKKRLETQYPVSVMNEKDQK